MSRVSHNKQKNTGRSSADKAHPKVPTPPVSPPEEASVALKEQPGVVEIPASLTVKELADLLELNVIDVIKELMKNGLMASINQRIDNDTATLIAQELGFEVKVPTPIEVKPEPAEEISTKPVLWEEEEPSLLVPRAPVVTVMGHVDHGKTSLLDAIREANVIASEAGGITQHIGAYQVEHQGKRIVFLDTPGHEAFTAMRARGAQVTDIAVLVVAADDGVMPQTLEAIAHAKAAKVPMLVAINKIDKPNSNPDKVKQELADAGVLVEGWGGDVISVPVSAKKRIGLEELLDMILLIAEVSEFKANPNRPAIGTVIEAKLDKTRGPLATVLVQNGTLRQGDNVVVGLTSGKVRAMINHKGKRVRKAEPATPVEILGLSDVPEAGDIVRVVQDEKTARAMIDERLQELRLKAEGPTKKVTLDDLFAQIQAGNIKELNLILKADVAGSIEAIRTALEQLNTEEVRINLIHAATGDISESDILLAAASGAIILGFNTKPDPAARKAIDAQGVDVRLYSVIYKLTDDIAAAMTGMLEPEMIEVIDGHGEVRATFKAGKNIIAGCYINDGKVTSNSRARLSRTGQQLFEGKIASLRRFKEDVREVTAGYECGIFLEGWNDIEVGDALEFYSIQKK